jgi:hypothetical protein
MPQPNDDLEVPDRLQGDLRAVFGRRVSIPDSIGATLRHAAARRRRPILLRPVTLAAAAALLVAALLQLQQRTMSPVPLAREDFDGNGRVDVLDAYRLALAVERHERIAPQFDLDGDGIVDRRDADRIAARAVSIKG